MLKYFITIIGFPCMIMAQSKSEVYYAAPYLKIEDVHKKAVTDVNDFGYNVMVHTENAFLKEGFFMWVDDQWYEILNANELFTPYNGHKTLFAIAEDHKNPLKIKDVNEVVYLFPIEALDTYKVSRNDLAVLSKAVVPEQVVVYQKTIEVKPAEKETVAEPSASQEKKEEQISLKEVNNENVLISSEDSSTVLLDVMDVVEVVKREEVPFKDDTQNPVVEEAVVNEPVVSVTEPAKEVSAKDMPVISNPQNDYEVAVNEGFEGTVTEWIESVNEKGGKTAYEQAVSKGFKGSEEDWMRSLWGRQADVEIAKRDKTTAIVSEWIQSLNTSNGSSPYELALKHGFYGTFTEWVESVIGSDGEKAYDHAKTQGFQWTYKEWIEQQLNNSNKEMLRKEMLAKTQMFVAPNVSMPVDSTAAEPLSFDLYDYYNQFYGSAVISSNGQTNEIEVKPQDLEYQITWFEKDKIKILELTKEGIIRYQPLDGVSIPFTKINIRYILK